MEEGTKETGDEGEGRGENELYKGSPPPLSPSSPSSPSFHVSRLTFHPSFTFHLSPFTYSSIRALFSIHSAAVI
jgi:hypothetical protein